MLQGALGRYRKPCLSFRPGTRGRNNPKKMTLQLVERWYVFVFPPDVNGDDSNNTRFFICSYISGMQASSVEEKQVRITKSRQL